MNNDDRPQLDLVNVAFILTSIGIIASQGWAIVLILAPIYYGQKYLRSRPAAREWTGKMLTAPKEAFHKALPAPKVVTDPTKTLKTSTAIATQLQKQENVRVVDPYAHLPFWDRVTKPYDSSTVIDTRNAISVSKNGKVKTNVEDRQYHYLNYAMKRLPAYVHYTQLPETIPSRLSVPIGVDAQTGNLLWGDFDADSDQARILHALIAGQTGAGKDALLRLWFTTLTINNTPEQIQFVILDGKTDWLSNELAASVYMAVPPAGGIQLKKVNGKRVDLAHERMIESMDWVFDEIDRRGDLFRELGAININAYNDKARKLGKATLPMLFLIASDVGKAFDDELGMLVQNLIMKGRSYGIRMIISMQDPVGENTGWRAQIGLVMSGYQQDPLHDNRIMGMAVGRLIVRPSQLPNPEEEDIAKGLFVVRQGSRQYVVRTAHLPEEDWFAYIGSNRFFKKWYGKAEQDSLLNEMLFSEPKMTRRLQPIPPSIMAVRAAEPSIRNPREILGKDQIVRIVALAKSGLTKTAIMEDLGFMNSEVWSVKVEAVEQVILSARGYIKPKGIRQ